MLGALGVVYGDIGTSPLYALRECFSGPHSIAPSPDNVLGVVSLVVWILTLTVSVKYLSLVMRADNRGAGGVLALLAMAQRGRDDKGRDYRLFLVLGVVGAALLYGDGMITPAVTVLSAVEGLEVATPVFRPYVVPLAVLILIGLFSFQRFGTGRVGSVFGPVMLLWFATLAALGIRGILLNPQILLALNPLRGAEFVIHHSREAFIVLGSVFLVVTGSESLYADMGHFGLRPIRRAWYVLVFPGLALNYLGEGALVMSDPATARNPFFLLAPDWALLPLVGLATVAAIIASQALISGAYSLTMQGIQLGLLPRMQVLHTSHAERGQIYVPRVNAFLMVACIALVLMFGSSSGLAAAYGIAVSMTMLVTTLLFYAAARNGWNWHPLVVGAVCVVFCTLELGFVAANSLKIPQGGWFPLLVGTCLFVVMMTWRSGRKVLRARLSESYLPFDLFLQDLDGTKVPRVPGTAVFLSGNPSGTPIALLHNLRHNKVLHQRVVLLTVSTRDIPWVRAEERIRLEQIRPDIHRLIASYGFMEQPNVPQLLQQCEPLGLKLNPAEVTYFVSRETILPSRGRGMARWRRRLFGALSRNAQPVTAFFQLVPNRVVELGMQVEV